MRYIVGVKPGDHKFLFELVKQSQCTEYSHQTEDGITIVIAISITLSSTIAILILKLIF